MQWLRNVFARKANQSTKSARPAAFRPSLETLDARDLPSVSSVLTASGLHQFVVNNTNSLVLTASPLLGGGGPATIITGTATTGVRTAQAFRTAGGLLGFDAVMIDGTWQHLEQGAGGVLPNGTYTTADLGLTGKILDVGTAYDSMGRLRVDILTTTGGGTSTALDVTGKLFEFNQVTGGGLMDTGLPNVRWVSTYLDTAGGTGIAVGQKFGTELMVRKGDAVSGVSTLYDGQDGFSGAITEYTQTVSPITAGPGMLPGIPGTVIGTPANRKVVIDVTFNNSTSLTATPGTYGLEYTFTSSTTPTVGVTGVGTDNTVKPGG